MENMKLNEYIISNPLVCNFYNDHPNIDFEEANILLVNIFKMCNDFSKKNPQQTQSNYGTVNGNELYTTKIKGETGENSMEIILNDINPTAEIIHNDNHSNFFYDFSVKRENKKMILIESKEFNTNIKTEEIELFVKSCQDTKSNGIFISQHSGITNKYNYQIDIIGMNIIIYVHHAEYSKEKIKVAFEMIDSIYEKIRYLNMESEMVISKEILSEINREYQFFIKQKDEIKSYIKDNQNKLLNQIEDVKFSNLDKYLSTKFLNSEKVGIHKCDLCNFYTSNTLKGMAAHKRGCKKKVPISNLHV